MINHALLSLLCSHIRFTNSCKWNKHTTREITGYNIVVLFEI